MSNPHTTGSRIQYSRFASLPLMLAWALVCGCSSSEGGGSPQTRGATASGNVSAAGSVNPPRSSDSTGDAADDKPPPVKSDFRQQERTFTDLLENAEDSPDPDAFGGANFGHPGHDDAKLASAGIRKIAGKHLTIYTDLPRGDVDDFPRVFDLAVPQWQAYFNLPADKLAQWRMTGYVIKDRQLFRDQGLLPDDLPDFAHGFQRAFELWVYDQPSDYYRRHLLLHEGTHGVMNTLLGAAGPPWYMEGVAELLATHQWNGGKLTLRYNPRDKTEVPFWGRVKLIDDDFAGNDGMTMSGLMNYDTRAHQNVNAYAWCWAACRFLDDHPATQAAFRKMQQHVRLPVDDFNRRLVEQIDDWPRIAREQWFLYVQSMAYGSDVQTAIVHYKDGAPLTADGAVAEIRADQGWQSSGVEVEAGKTYHIRAAGKYTIAREADGTRWPCEPGGVTLRYHATRPLGELLLAIRDGEPEAGRSPSLAVPVPVGLRKAFTPNRSGTLYFLVNDSPAERDDNEGTLKVQVKAGS